MYSLSEIAGILGRDRIALLGLLKRFDLPICKGGSYPDCYVSFLKSVIFMRLAQITEGQILELWSLEHKLMTILHVDLKSLWPALSKPHQSTPLSPKTSRPVVMKWSRFRCQ